MNSSNDAIIAYANQLFKDEAAADASFDDLASYVTGFLQQEPVDDVRNLSEYESICELIAEQIQVTQKKASQILQQILEGMHDETKLFPVNTTVPPPVFDREQAIQMLIYQAQSGLSLEAANQAMDLANNDVQVAYFVVNKAQQAPPVCRHLLNAGCYRSDCQFSHDVDHHTCLFWMRGYCAKGSSCRFLHGFSSKVLEELFPPAEQAPTYDPIVIPEDPPLKAPPASEAWPAPAQSKSFANIAKGLKKAGIVDTTAPSPVIGKRKIPTVRIPQNLWNAHENRDSSAFYIEDPIERYRFVARTVHRDDVLDLHFQSTKTYAAVLEQILPEMLQSHEEVWIVTGTGHHVGTQTHQKGGGVLENAVANWLSDQGYNYCRGKDRSGQGGALLVKNNL